MPDPTGTAIDRPRLHAVASSDGGGSRLFTAVLSLMDAEGVFEIFHACHAASAAEVKVRLAVRVGATRAALATVRGGVDPADPVAAALASAATLDALATAGDFAGRPLATGGDLHVRQWRT